jgi:hypothetical protein
MRASASAFLPSWTIVHLLTSHAANCITHSEACTGSRGKRVLRLLAADLLIEAESQRAILRRLESANLAGAEKQARYAQR